MRELYECYGLRKSLTEKGGQWAVRFSWEASAAELARIYRLTEERFT